MNDALGRRLVELLGGEIVLGLECVDRPIEGFKETLDVCLEGALDGLVTQSALLALAKVFLALLVCGISRLSPGSLIGLPQHRTRIITATPGPTRGRKLAVDDSPLNVVSVMNYPPEPRYRRMCHIFLDTVIAHGAKSITLLWEDHRPVIATAHRRAVDIEVRQERSHDVGHPHFNLRFKLANLAALTFPFLYLDADMVVLSDLNYLWQRRGAKPWIGIDHQVVPSDVRTHRSPFLNAGLQLVSDPSFYDLRAMLDVQNAVVPLNRHEEIDKNQMFPCPGRDQAVLYRYFRAIGYDYTHPEIGPEWNSCRGVTEVYHDGGAWKARARGTRERVSGPHYPLLGSVQTVEDRLPDLSIVCVGG